MVKDLMLISDSVSEDSVHPFLIPCAWTKSHGDRSYSGSGSSSQEKQRDKRPWTRYVQSPPTIDLKMK